MAVNKGTGLIVKGSVLLALALGLYLWVSQHSPNMGFMQMMAQPNNFIIKQPFYNILLFVDGVLALVGGLWVARGLSRGERSEG